MFLKEKHVLFKIHVSKSAYFITSWYINNSVRDTFYSVTYNFCMILTVTLLHIKTLTGIRAFEDSEVYFKNIDWF